MGRNMEKKPWTNLQNLYNNLSKEINSDNFCYHKVGRAITKWGTIEKSPILLSQYWKNYSLVSKMRIKPVFLQVDNLEKWQFIKGNKNYFPFSW